MNTTYNKVCVVLRLWNNELHFSSFRLDELEVQRAQKRKVDESEIADVVKPPTENASVNVERGPSPSHVIDMELCDDEPTTFENQSLVVDKPQSVEEERAEAYQARVAAADSFNTFQYWREPVAELSLPELGPKTETLPCENIESKKVDESPNKDPNVIDLPHENEFEEDEDEMEIEPLFGDDEEYDDSRVEELHKLENHLKRVLDKGNKEMDHLTEELSEARLGSQSGGNKFFNYFLIIFKVCCHKT